MGSGLTFPLPVLHVDLEGLEARRAPDARAALLVFFANGLPVGQAYVGIGGLEKERLPDIAARSVSPAALAAATVASTFDVLSATVTVVVCTRDRPMELKRCLASLACQSRRPDRIVVVDNASADDRTRAVAEEAGIDYVREERPGLDHARNAGVSRCHSEIVAFIDDDALAHPRWLERLVAAFDAAEIQAVTGLVLPGELETEAQYIFETQWGFGRGYERIDFGPDFYAGRRRRGCPAWRIGAGVNMAFRRHVFEQVGPFDERLDVGAAGCSGDSEMWNRILHHGFTCRYEPLALVLHYHRRTMQELARQIRAYMSGHVAALLVQYQRTRERGNLRRLFLVMPAWFLRRWLQRLRRGRTAQNILMREEVLGCFDGLVYFLRAPRPASMRDEP
jgi:glycosyltransferase involved in cell wall biosynthesis